MLVMLVMWVMSLVLLLLLLSPQGTGWLLLAMADLSIGKTAVNRMLVSSAATQWLRQYPEFRSARSAPLECD